MQLMSNIWWLVREIPTVNKVTEMDWQPQGSKQHKVSGFKDNKQHTEDFLI